MLTEICGYLKNYFVDKAYLGIVKITEGAVSCNGEAVSIEEGQYFTLVREKYVLGVYKYGTDTIPNKEFSGAVWIMDIPADVMAIAAEIVAWQEKYGSADSAAMSPYNSESFGGYSYSKASGSVAADGSTSLPAWAAAFGGRLARYRRL